MEVRSVLLEDCLSSRDVDEGRANSRSELDGGALKPS